MAEFFKTLRQNRYFDVACYGLIALFCAYLLFPNGFEGPIYPYEASQPWWILLDTSWVMTLNYVKMHGITWGTDVAFTYGPLGFLATRFGWGESRNSFLLADLFVFLNWALMFYYSLKNSRNKFLTSGFILLLTLFLPMWIGGRIALYLLVFLAFWIRQNAERKTLISFAMQIVIIALSFFIKFNSGLICLPLYFLGIAFMAYSKRIGTIETIVYSLLPIALIVALSAYFNVSLFAYFTSGMQLISGYNEIMYENYPQPGSGVFLSLVLMIIIGIMACNFFGKQKADWTTRIFLAIIAAVPLFVAYKQGFTRSNPGYNEDFFACLLVYGVAASDLHYHLKSKILKGLAICIPLLATYYLYIHIDKPFETPNKFSKANYISGYENFNPDSDVLFKQGATKFPADVTAKIGRHTVDVYPWNIRMLIENEVNYLPRPVLQAYSAYTPELGALNFARYNDAATAPDYVIYEHNSLDSRYPLFDEPKVVIALERNYTVEQTFDYNAKKLLLLKKKHDFKPVRFEPVKEYAMMLETPLSPQNGIFYEVTHYNNLIGKIYGIFAHAPEIRLQVRVKDGTTTEYKTSNKLLQSGVFEDNFIETTEDFADIVSSGRSKKKVSFYYFDARKEGLFRDKIRVREYRIVQ